MSTELLTQVLIIATIVAVIYLILVLKRAYEVLGDTKEVSTIAAKRTKEVDERISAAENKLDSFSDAVRGFVYSFDFIKMLRDKLMNEKKKKSDD